jgi:hypothetical protein
MARCNGLGIAHLVGKLTTVIFSGGLVLFEGEDRRRTVRCDATSMVCPTAHGVGTDDLVAWLVSWVGDGTAVGVVACCACKREESNGGNYKEMGWRGHRDSQRSAKRVPCETRKWSEGNAGLTKRDETDKMREWKLELGGS